MLKSQNIKETGIRLQRRSRTPLSAILAQCILIQCALATPVLAQPFQPNQGPEGGFLSGQAKMDETPSTQPSRVAPFTLNATQEGDADEDDPLAGRATGQGAAPLSGRAWDDKFNGLTGVGQTDNTPVRLPAGLANDNTFKLRAQDARTLSRFNIQLLVDRSNSMRACDCPYGLSRWQWCGLQATSLASALDPLTTNGLTVTTFATQFDVFDNADARSVQYIFQNVQTQNGTRLYEPLAEQADRYFNENNAAKKPLLIVVVTDGVPAPRWEPVRVREELIAISKRVKNPADATVIFCQVGGNDRMGRAYLQDLDQNLTAYGARYNMVHTVAFDDLMKMGLGTALSSAIQKYAPPQAVAQDGDGDLDGRAGSKRQKDHKKGGNR